MKDHKLQNLTAPRMQMYLAVMAVFAIVTFFIHKTLAYVEAGVIVVLIIYTVIRNRRRRRELRSFVESVTYSTESATNNTLIHFPLPMAVFHLNDSSVVWANELFWTMCGRNGPALDTKVSALIPGFSGKWLLENKTRMPELIEVKGRIYEVNGNIARSGTDETIYDYMGITYWVDVTEYEDIHHEYLSSRPVVMLIVVDNYDELMKSLTDRQRSELRGRVDEAVEKWSEGKNGMMRRFDRDRYIFIIESRYMPAITEERFSLVEGIHSIVNPSGIHATVSIGAGLDGGSFAENYSFAVLATDMALSRGGDQAVIKNKFNFEFYGGRGSEVETRTKVKSRVMANALSRLIEQSSRVYVMGHRFSDMDSIGAAVGIACIARSMDCPARIVLNMEANAGGELLKTLLSDESIASLFISEQDAIVQADNHTLLVVVDTHRPEQVESESLLTACSNRLAVIDHHRRAATYIQDPTLSLYEPNASSACELVTELLEELVEQQSIRPIEADAVLAGIVLDTKSFTIRTGERTFDAAAFLRRAGADPVRVKKLLQSGMTETIERYDILRDARLHRGIAIATANKTHNRVIAAQAADEMLNISGVTASVVLYPTENGGTAISARSIGEVNVQVLLEKLGGGGNQAAAGAQLPDTPMRDAFNRLCAAIDEYMDTE